MGGSGWEWVGVVSCSPRLAVLVSLHYIMRRVGGAYGVGPQYNKSAGNVQ